LEKSGVVLKPIIVFLTGFLPHDFAAAGLRAKLNTTHVRPGNWDRQHFVGRLSSPMGSSEEALLGSSQLEKAGPVGFEPTSSASKAKRIS
jgi:hypothetical protein